MAGVCYGPNFQLKYLNAGMYVRQCSGGIRCRPCNAWRLSLTPKRRSNDEKTRWARRGGAGRGGASAAVLWPWLRRRRCWPLNDLELLLLHLHPSSTLFRRKSYSSDSFSTLCCRPTTCKWMGYLALEYLMLLSIVKLTMSEETSERYNRARKMTGHLASQEFGFWTTMPESLGMFGIGFFVPLP